jgi:hypothetical protein
MAAHKNLSRHILGEEEPTHLARNYFMAHGLGRKRKVGRKEKKEENIFFIAK